MELTVAGLPPPDGRCGLFFKTWNASVFQVFFWLVTTPGELATKAPVGLHSPLMRIARELIDQDAEKVVRRLARHGYKAYLVGGCVRDLLLSRTPKDFDVATSATPKETKQLFRNCRIIGRRFRLAHIFFGGKIIETSTFRANPRQGEHEGELLIRRDNVFGSDTEDARRRDFTINGLFYDVEAEEVIDYVGGLKDLEARVISTIGNPDIRFQEDPVRMLRAIKFAARLEFQIADESYEAILRQREDISKCAQPRVLEELYRLLRSGAARRSIKLLMSTGIARTLSPELESLFAEPSDTEDEDTDDEPTQPIARHQPKNTQEDWASTWNDDSLADSKQELTEVAVPTRKIHLQVWRVLDELDELARQKKELSNVVLLAAICAPLVVQKLLQPDLRPSETNAIVDAVLAPLCLELQVARRDAERCRNVLVALRRLAPAKRRRGRPMTFVRRDYFEEALLVYEITGRATGALTVESADYWRKLQSQDSSNPSRKPEKRRRRRRGGRRRRFGHEPGYPESSDRNASADKQPDSSKESSSSEKTEKKKPGRKSSTTAS